MKKELNINQKMILMVLLKASKYMYIFTLVKRLHMDIYSINTVVNQLLNLGYIEREEENNYKIRITKQGSEWFMKNSSYLLTKEKPWRKTPEEFIQHQISPNDFYIPLPKYLDKNFFKKYSKKGGNKAGG